MPAPLPKVANLGSYATAGQLQQRPAPMEGGILKLKWLRYYDPRPSTWSSSASIRR